MEDQITLDSYISTNKKSDKSEKNNKGRQNRNRDDNNQRRGNNQRGNNRFRNRGGNDDRRRHQNRNRRDNQRDSSNWNDNKFDRRQRKGSFNNKDEERTTGKYVVIENLHYSITEEELQEHVSKYGEVIQCKIFWDENGRSKEKAIVQFENEEDAKEAIEDLEGSTLEDQTLSAHYASNDDVGYIKKTKKIQKQSKAFNRRR
ncbi:hypothetical protein ABPG74_011545 [Tetrahymena malaccensis]